MSHEIDGPSRETSMVSCSTFSFIEDYYLKVICEAKMDIDNKIIPNRSWADQVDANQPFAKESSNPQSIHKDYMVTPAEPSQHAHSHGTAHKHVAPAPNTSVVILYNENQLANLSL